MKKLIAFGAVLALAGCSQEAADEPIAEEVVAEEAVPEKVVTNAFDVTGDDGETTSLVLYDDGTFLFGEMTGTYSEKDGMTCYVADEGEGEETCWSAAVEGEDGTWTSTSEDGEVVTLTEPS